LQQEIRTVTMQLITDHWSVSAKSPVRSITVGVSHLSGENEAYTEQLSLFDLCTSVGNAEKEPTVGLEKQEKVEAAVQHADCQRDCDWSFPVQPRTEAAEAAC
jgi:hypothetical protein